MSDKQTYTRRRVMQSGAATAGLLAVGSLSGCGSIPFVGGGGGAYLNWVAAPDEIGPNDHGGFSVTKFNQISQNEDNFDEEAFDSFEENFGESIEDSFGIDDWTSITWAASVPGGFVYNGDFSKSTVVDGLEDGGNNVQPFVEDDTYEGYTLMVTESFDQSDRTDPRQAVAVNEGTVVFGRASQGNNGIDENAIEVLEILIDTNNGNGTRFTDDNEAFNKLTSELGDGTWVNGQTIEEVGNQASPAQGRFEGMVGSGLQRTVNGQETSAKYVAVFEDADAAQDASLDEYQDALEDRDADWNDTSVSRNGRAGVITGNVDTDEFTSLGGF